MSNEADLTPYQLWVLGLNAILAEQNEMDHSTVRGIQYSLDKKGEDRTPGIKHALQRDWDTSNRAELMDSIRFCFRGVNNDEGFRQCEVCLSTLRPGQLDALEGSFDDAFYQRMKIVSMYTGSVQSLEAYNIARGILLCRWGLTAELITEKDFWRLVKPFANKAKAIYRSWEDYSIGYAVGRQFSFYKSGQDGVKNAVYKLFTEQASPYVTCKWPSAEAA